MIMAPTLGPPARAALTLLTHPLPEPYEENLRGHPHSSRGRPVARRQAAQTGSLPSGLASHTRSPSVHFFHGPGHER